MTEPRLRVPDPLDAIADVDLHPGIVEANGHGREILLGCLWHVAIDLCHVNLLQSSRVAKPAPQTSLATSG
jgi:hypothetical protein